MTACTVGTDESGRNWLTHTYIVAKRLCSGHDVSDPALRLPRQPILKHQDNEPLPSYAYWETLCRACDD
jgi:hypothetical protein